jgi:hypothetical protein
MLDKLSQLWRRLLFYLWRDRFDRELEEEMRFHLEMKAQENAKPGWGQWKRGMPHSGDSAIKHCYGR